MRTEWTLLFPLLFLWASAQDQNFGKKVKCYMVEGIAMCPGCNSRAGLICPRVIPDENKCDEPPVTKAPVDERTRKETTLTPTPLPTTVAIETTKPAETSTIARTTLEVPIKPEEKVGGKFAKPTPIDMQIFLYQVLQNSNARKRPYLEIPRRLRRDAAEEETCQWNGDCPCPQICCGNGDNKPKTCKRGIRLPPPWGG